MSKARFIIRWDDVSPFQDRHKYRSLIDLFIKHDIPAVLGVIPENCDETIQFDHQSKAEFIDELHQLEKSGWEIAQHGYRHLQHTDDGGILNLNDASEFAGRPYDDQLDDIEKGKKLLAEYGFDPVTFIPPWHSYDKATLKAMTQSGFRVLSDGLFLYPRRAGAMIQLPQIFWSVPGRLRTLNKIGSVYTICIHPQLTTTDDLNTLKEFFAEAKANITTASSLLADDPDVAKRGIRKRILELIFKSLYRWNR